MHRISKMELIMTRKELNEIKKNKWFQNASKIGFAVGDDADIDMITDVVGNSEAVIRTDDMETFAKLIKLASVTASKIGSVSRTSASGDISEEIVKTVTDNNTGKSSDTGNQSTTGNVDPYPGPDPNPGDDDSISVDAWDEDEFD